MSGDRRNHGEGEEVVSFMTTFFVTDGGSTRLLAKNPHYAQ